MLSVLSIIISIFVIYKSYKKEKEIHNQIIKDVTERPNFSFISFTCGEAKEVKVSDIHLSEDLRQMSDEFWEETKNYN